MAAIAESLRFLAIVFLAFDLGALQSASVSGLLRYAAAPQLLFAAGFFFLWLDPKRYGSYRPLLAIGKLASLVCYVPLAMALARDPKASGPTFGISLFGLALAAYIAIADLASASVLLLARPLPAVGPDPSKPATPGQGPDDIERVEGM
jgi:hypothetical protein